MKKRKDSLQEEAGGRQLHPQKVVQNVLGKQHKIKIKSFYEVDIDDD